MCADIPRLATLGTVSLSILNVREQMSGIVVEIGFSITPKLGSLSTNVTIL